MSSKSISTNEWLAAAAYRRTIYGLKDTSSVSDSRVQDIVQQVLSHKFFWDTIIKAAERMLRNVPDEKFRAISAKLNSHKQARGSIWLTKKVVFWESGNTIQESGEKHQSAANLFPMYADHSSGMAQIMVWTALELEGLGANLQHIGALPDVENEVTKFCGVPEDYNLKAHLNFGDKGQDHPPKPEKLSLSETLQIMK